SFFLRLILPHLQYALLLVMGHWRFFSTARQGGGGGSSDPTSFCGRGTLGQICFFGQKTYGGEGKGGGNALLLHGFDRASNMNRQPRAQLRSTPVSICRPRFSHISVRPVCSRLRRRNIPLWPTRVVILDLFPRDGSIR